MRAWHKLAGLLVTVAGIATTTSGCFLFHSLEPGRAGSEADAGTVIGAVDAGLPLPWPPAPADAGVDAGQDSGPVCRPPIEPFPMSLGDARLSWQGPGGAAGWGPALVLAGNGRVRMWRQAGGFDPGGEPPTPPDAETRVPQAQLDALFSHLVTVDYAALPHPGGGGECYATLWFRASSASTPTQLQYDSAARVSPDLECVWQWFDAELGDTYAEYAPRGYCGFGP